MLSPRGLALSLALAALVSHVSASCSSYSTRYGADLEGVCVCSAQSCDEISSAYKTLPSDLVGVFLTSQRGDRLAYTTLSLDGAASTTDAAVEIALDSSITYQKIQGFGGAFTDSTAINAYKLTSELQDKLLDAYFGDNGLQYTLGRVPIGSTDFSEYVYSYNDKVDDLEMANFTIAIDKSTATNKLAFLKRALAMSSREVALFASSWAPPAWMTREKKVQNSHIVGEPGEPYWKALALYYSRFLDEYKKEGVNFWAMTTQNEPFDQGFSLLSWQQLRFNDTEERDFIKKDLGPLMKKNHPELKIIMMDDQKDLLPTWTGPLEDAESRQYISGIGVHWYKNLDFITEGLGNFQQLADFHAKYPDVFILATEACAGSMPSVIGTGRGVRIREPSIIWKRAENYARDIINDLANYAVGWTDWNMVLDTTGGPTWVRNTVDAPILIDEKSGKEFYKQPMYYIMGHFSKFLPVGSIRVGLTASSSLENVDRVAFRTPSGQLVVIISNRDSKPITMKLRDVQNGRAVTLELPANAVQTVLFSASITPSPSPSSVSPVPTSPTTSTPCPLPTPRDPETTAPPPTSVRPAC